MYVNRPGARPATVCDKACNHMPRLHTGSMYVWLPGAHSAFNHARWDGACNHLFTAAGCIAHGCGLHYIRLQAALHTVAGCITYGCRLAEVDNDGAARQQTRLSRRTTGDGSAPPLRFCCKCSKAAEQARSGGEVEQGWGYSVGSTRRASPPEPQSDPMRSQLGSRLHAERGESKVRREGEATQFPVVRAIWIQYTLVDVDVTLSY